MPIAHWRRSRRAIATGYRDAEQMRKDPDLDPIRSSPEFTLLLLDLAFPTDPFSKDSDAVRAGHRTP